MSDAIHLVECRRIVTNLIRIRILHVNRKRLAICIRLSNRIDRENHKAVT